MITVKAKLQGLDTLASTLKRLLPQALPLETRQRILAEEGQVVADRMIAVAPRGPHDPHAADFIAVTPVPGTADAAQVAIGVVDVPGTGDRGFVLGFVEYGTRKRGARPFLRPTADVELPLMLERVRDRVAKELTK